MYDLSEQELQELLKNIPDYQKTDLLIFAVSLNQFERESIFFDQLDVNLYREKIEEHISIISKNRYMKINKNTFLFIIMKKDTPINIIEKRILTALYKSIRIGDHSVYIPYVIGSSKYPQDSNDIVECIKFARVAKTYLAENSLKHYAKYEKSIYDDAYEEFIIKNALVSAIENNELEMYYQPIFDQEKEKIIYFEALLRWKRDGRFINPQKIIEIAEKTENIHLLTEHIAEIVVLTLTNWQKNYNNMIPISINISQSALTNPKLPWKLYTLLEKYNIKSNQLKIEITETTSSKFFSSINYERVTPNQISSKLGTLGFDLYADDFGVGFSNLEFISSHGFKGIKIDKFFIDRIIGDKGKYFLSLVRKIFELAKENNQIVICEGIEKQEQLDLLNSIGIGFCVQGYLYSKPLSQEQVKKTYFV